MMCGFCAPWRQVLTHDTEVRPPTQLKVRTPSACAGASAPGAASVATTARPASAVVDLAYNIGSSIARLEPGSGNGVGTGQPPRRGAVRGANCKADTTPAVPSRHSASAPWFTTRRFDGRSDQHLLGARRSRPCRAAAVGVVGLRACRLCVARACRRDPPLRRLRARNFALQQTLWRPQLMDTLPTVMHVAEWPRRHRPIWID